MGILYHDNNIHPQYGPDGKLLNNWDETADYENEYANVHFRIDVPAYDLQSHSFSEEDRERFRTEAVAVFRSLGWIPEAPECSGACTTVIKGKANLYLHPQDFSGELPKNEIGVVARALERNQTFSLQWVDVYETVYDMTDAAYLAYLKTRSETIRAEILAAGQTNRRYLFFRDYDIACRVALRVGLKRVGERDLSDGGAGKTANFIVGMIPQLIAEGYLVASSDGDGSRLIRTINKTEQRQRKLKIA